MKPCHECGEHPQTVEITGIPGDRWFARVRRWGKCIQHKVIGSFCKTEMCATQDEAEKEWDRIFG